MQSSLIRLTWLHNSDKHLASFGTCCLLCFYPLVAVVLLCDWQHQAKPWALWIVSHGTLQTLSRLCRIRSTLSHYNKQMGKVSLRKRHRHAESMNETEFNGNWRTVYVEMQFCWFWPHSLQRLYTSTHHHPFILIDQWIQQPLPLILPTLNQHDYDHNYDQDNYQ